MPARIAGSAVLAALWTGFSAAAIGCFIAVAGALLSWIPDAGATGSSGSTVRAGVLTFLAAQHGGTRLNGQTLHFVPLGLTFIAVWLCWRGGRVLQLLPVARTDQRERRIFGLALAQVGAYGLTCAVLTHFSVIGTSSVPTLGAVVGAGAVGAVGFGSAAVMCTPIGAERWIALPPVLRSGLRGAAGGTAVFIAGGALLAAGATAVRAGRFLELSRGLGRGLSGLPIAALDLLSAPNAILAGSSYLAGPGFAVGVHSTYAPRGGTAGLVPAFPVLAGLPSGSRASSLVLALMALTIVGSAAATALLVRRSAPTSGWLAMLGGCLLAGVFTGFGLGLLIALAGGNLGSDNLRAVGASPGHVALMTAAEVVLISVPVAIGVRLLSGRSRSIESLVKQSIAPAVKRVLEPIARPAAANDESAKAPSAKAPSAKVPSAEAASAKAASAKAPSVEATPAETAAEPPADAGGEADPQDHRAAS
ncbi:MAG: hypothetical protein JWM76_3367 [Pseudonocardiales bacterium]|nr:hypothetical protein [Pseudonocardiales bacterium]